MKQRAPAAARNREPIAEVMAEELPASGLVLEIASGTGEHAVHFAAAFPGVAWQPSDPDEGARASIEAWRKDVALPNLRPVIEIDASRPDSWSIDRADAMVCINMIHISPWEATLGLFEGAGRLLPSGGKLVLYGPYLEADVETAESNLAFDASLKARNPAWGIRNLADIDAVAAQNSITRTRRTEMPANNLTLVYTKA